MYLPGWEVQKLRNELFTDSYGFIVDYLAEVLKDLRKDDYSHLCSQYFDLSEAITTRDRTGVLKTFSGLCKIIYPHGECSQEEAREILNFALEGRRRVKNQLVQMDDTFNEVDFSYTLKGENNVTTVLTFEEKQYPSLVKNQVAKEHLMNETNQEIVIEDTGKKKPVLISGKHIVVAENQKGISYHKLFAPYLEGTSKITIFDPYVRQFYQAKNVMEFIQMVLSIKPEGEDIDVKLVTKYDEYKEVESTERFQLLKDSIEGSGISFEFEYDQAQSFHARSIETDTGWKISLDRGLDIFQAYDFRNPFNLANSIQEERFCKGFEVTYLKNVD